MQIERKLLIIGYSTYIKALVDRRAAGPWEAREIDIS